MLESKALIVKLSLFIGRIGSEILMDYTKIRYKIFETYIVAFGGYRPKLAIQELLYRILFLDSGVLGPELLLSCDQHTEL